MSDTSINSHVAVLNIKKCLGCGECIDICPTDAIPPLLGLYSALLEIDKTKCNGCGECIPICNHNAIKLVESSNRNFK
ncbi:MAG: hypothetical protein EU529_15030 [Promethearchaeota archaeon]|nr:MAG: hypothetical protein EU529_15030 [Candidatus Lokiarchaeota archaeon]